MVRRAIVVPGSRVSLAVSGRRKSVSVAGDRVSLSVAQQRRSVVVHNARVSVGVGSLSEAAPTVLPRLLSCHIEAPVAGVRVNVTESVWSDLGKIRYSVVNESTGVRSNASTYSPSTAATSYALAKYVSGLATGETYSLEYWLDCIPDISGYTEGWRSMGMAWVQPGEDGTDFLYDWSQP